MLKAILIIVILLFLKLILFLLAFLELVLNVVEHLERKRIARTSTKRGECQVFSVEFQVLVEPSFVEVIRKKKDSNKEERCDEKRLNDFKGDAVSMTMLLKEPANLQQWIRYFSQPNGVHNEELFTNLK
jgi:hypothetical protein